MTPWDHTRVTRTGTWSITYSEPQGLQGELSYWARRALQPKDCALGVLGLEAAAPHAQTWPLLSLKPGLTPPKYCRL